MCFFFDTIRRDPTPAQVALEETCAILTLSASIDWYTHRHNQLLSPKLYGLTKLHKLSNTHAAYMVSLCGSLTYQLSKYLTIILKTVTDKSRRELPSTEDCLDAIMTVLQTCAVWCEITTDHQQSTSTAGFTAYWVPFNSVKLSLPPEDIMYLLNLCLTWTCF